MSPFFLPPLGPCWMSQSLCLRIYCFGVFVSCVLRVRWCGACELLDCFTGQRGAVLAGAAEMHVVCNEQLCHRINTIHVVRERAKHIARTVSQIAIVAYCINTMTYTLHGAWTRIITKAQPTPSFATSPSPRRPSRHLGRSSSWPSSVFSLPYHQYSLLNPSERLQSFQRHQP